MNLAGQQFAQKGGANLDWMEKGLRAALLADGRALLEDFLNQADLHIPEDSIRPGERCYARRTATWQSSFGILNLSRNYYRQAEKNQSRFPLDEMLGIVENCTPAMARMMCRAGSYEAFESASQTLEYFGGVAVEGRRIQRLINQVGPDIAQWTGQLTPPSPAPSVPAFDVEADGTGVPMRQTETKGRKGKQPGGLAKGREVKLGCVFTQHSVDEKGFPLRDPNTTSYIASFAGAKNFGAMLRFEAQHRGLAGAAKTVFLGDGAPWIWNLARVNFPGAIFILDFHHASEHLNSLTEALYGKDPLKAKEKFLAWQELFKSQREGLQTVLDQAQAALPKNGPRRKAAKSQLAYFAKNKKKLRYFEFRTQGLFVGSGVVEAGCKTTVGRRVKQSGMFWKVSGSQNVLTTRCSILSRRYEDYWKNRCQPKIQPLSFAA